MNFIDPWGLCASDAEAAKIVGQAIAANGGASYGMPVELKEKLGITIETSDVTDKSDPVLKNRLIGAGTAVGGIALAVVSGVLIEKSGGEAPQDLGTAFVIGVQATALGFVQAVTGKDLVGNPIEMVKPIVVDVLEAVGDLKKEDFYKIDMEKLKI